MTDNDCTIATAEDPPKSNESLRYEPAPTETIVEAVVSAVSSVLDTDRENLEPLYSAVDPDALRSLVDSFDDESARDGDHCIVFEYEAHRIRIDSRRTVTIY